jgi:hypothetical protein
MPASFSVTVQDLDRVLRELRQLDPNLRKELVSEMKAAVTPVGQRLLAKIPPDPPLSGFGRGNGAVSPYVYQKPKMTTRTPFAKRAKMPGFFPVVSIRFDDRRPNAGLSILELAGTRNIGRAKGGLTPQGAAMIRNLPSMKLGLGRFVIPNFKGEQASVTKAAVRVLEKFANKVNQKIRGR